MSEGIGIFISYIGSLAYSPPKGILLVEDDADYVQACYLLVQQRRPGVDLQIWVRLKAHYVWLQDFVAQIGCQAVFAEKTPLTLLAERWNVVLPEWLQDADVLDNALLETEMDLEERVSFETRYLMHFLGPAFYTEKLKPENLVAVVKSLAGVNLEDAFQTGSLLHRCLDEKCAQWSKKSDERWIKDLCTKLTRDFTLLWSCLSAWSVLHGYPEKLLEYVIAPDQVVFVRRIPPDLLSRLPLESVAREQVLTQIEHYFEEIKGQVKTSVQFEKIVNMMSGRFAQEYRIALDILKSKQFEPTQVSIQAMRTKFEYCPGVSQNQLNMLAYLVKPARPTFRHEAEEWDALRWIEWTVKEYIPFRSWQVYNNYYDSELEEEILSFTDWYVREYALVHSEPELSLAYCLKGLSEENKENFTVILLVDCLPLNYVDILDDALYNVGLSRGSYSYRFAGLPTDTANNKAALLAGDWQESRGDYKAILKDRSGSDWGGKEIIYLNNLKSMSEITVVGPAIAVLNMRDSDDILHSDVESRNVMYEDELYLLFNRLAEEVKRLSEEWAGAKENFDVYVVTDHGACRILEEEKRSFDSVIVKKLFPDEKYRFAAVSEEQAEAIPQNLWDIGRKFRQPFTSQNTIFFIPLGHNTVRHAGAVKGYIHGGATPEEVIVPTAHYKLVKTAWEKPFARFLDLILNKETGRAQFYIQRVVGIEIEIQNPNRAEMTILRASIISPEVDLKGFEAASVPAKDKSVLTISSYFKGSALGEKDLEIEIVYEIEGEKLALSLSLKSEFKSAQKGGFSLKDLS